MIAEVLPVYHWAPKHCRKEILEKGLVPGSASPSGVPLPFVCTAVTPRRAWSLSGDTNWGEDFDEWDCWSVLLSDHDDIRYRTEEGPEIWEVRIHNIIPPDRLWFVGSREPWLTEQPKPEDETEND